MWGQAMGAGGQRQPHFLPLMPRMPKVQMGGGEELKGKLSGKASWHDDLPREGGQIEYLHLTNMSLEAKLGTLISLKQFWYCEKFVHDFTGVQA